MSSEYPHIEQGINKFTADVFNRLMDDLKHGEVNWPTLHGLIRDRGGVGGGTTAPAARLCIIGGHQILDNRDPEDEEDPPEYYGQWIYEWAEVSNMALLIGQQPNCGGNPDVPGVPAGIKFNTEGRPCGNDCVRYGISKSSTNWAWPLGIGDASDSGKRYPFTADPNQPARYYTYDDDDNPRTSELDRRMWRFIDHTGLDCCGYDPTDCTAPVFASGGAMNIAEASTDLYGGTPGNFIFPGVKLRDGCLSTSLKDIEVQPIKQGSLVWMHLVPFYANASEGDSPNWQTLHWINMFTAANTIDACCQPPEGEGAAAGSVSFRSVGDGEITTSADFHYNETTNTLHVPNISTTGTLTNTGLSTDAELSYIGPIHTGRGGNAIATAPTKAVFQPFVFHTTVKTKFVTMNGTHSTNLGSMNIAIYNDESGRPGTKVADSGATLVGAATATTAVSYVLTLPAGAYWIGSCINSGTVRVSGTVATSCNQASVPRATADFDTGKGAWETVANTTSLPTDITLTSELQPSGLAVPRIGLEFQSV